VRTIGLKNFGFALFCLLLSNSNASGQTPEQNQALRNNYNQVYCVSSYDQANIYFSDVFETQVPTYGALNVREEIAKFFEAHLKQKYGYNGGPNARAGCILLAYAVGAEENKKQALARSAIMGKQVVETGWKLSSQQAAVLPTPMCEDMRGVAYPCAQTSAPPPSAPAAPGASATANPIATRYEVCRAVTSVRTGGKYTTYFSDVMPRANINEADYSAAFVAFLAKKYGVQGLSPDPSMCTMVPSQAEGQKLVEQGWWKVNPYFSTAVQTGWTYSPSSRPEPPAPAASGTAVPPARDVPAAPVPSTPAPSTTSPSATNKPSAPTSRYAYCYSTDGAHTAYFSAPFKVADGDSTKWRQAFAAFLQKNYHAGVAPGCYRHSSLADAQSDLKKLEAAFPPTSKIIETGWEYK
jgi:hypothetical protein